MFVMFSAICKFRVKRLLCGALLFLQSCIHVQANPVDTHTVSKSPLNLQSIQPVLEERQVLMGVFIAGLLTARLFEYLKYTARASKKRVPGWGTGPGTFCFPSGSWTYKEPINEVANDTCTTLTSRALNWIRSGDTALMNPTIHVQSYSNGTFLLNEEGFRQELSIALIDANGMKGAPFYNHAACMQALQTILYDCTGANSDTRGGLYFYGNDGVVAYGVDPVCIGTPEKPCGAHI